MPSAGEPSADEDPDADLEDFDPAEERPRQPFESVNGLRGPGLSINGLHLSGERGSVRLMITAYDEGRDIVFQFLPREETPADWLAACPRSSEDPKEARIEVKLDGVGELSDNVMQQDEFGWSTGIPILRYTRLTALRFEICGASYALQDAYHERFGQHVRLSTKRAVAAYEQERRELAGSCKQGKSEACTELGDMLMYGEGRTQDVGGALLLYSEQCERGVGAGCLGASTATLAAIQPGQDKAAVYRKAVDLALRACELGDKSAGWSCWRAAALQAAGITLPADPKSAKQNADAACKRGFRVACTEGKDLVSCARGAAEACVRLADAQAERQTTRDDGAQALWRLAACRRNHAASCER
ncbi:MAG TPA: tetratricopeptide repeat protein [Polyangiaceae bacterium]|nr:tetratricopeptide repeat protein [Polyangiaceae bacterium]